jgi:ribokinase
MAPVVCVGDALVDLIVRVPDLPRRGRAVWSPPPTRVAGGTAANVAAGLAHLGYPVAFVGRVGADDHGRFLIEDLRARGVDVRGVVPDAAGTGVAISLVEPDGERTFLACALGAAQTRLVDADVHAIVRARPAAVFLTGLLLLEEPARQTALRLAASLREAGIEASFDPNLRQPAAAMPAALRVAMRTLAASAGVVLAAEEEVGDLGLAPRPGQTFAVKRGSRGASLLLDDGGSVDLPGHAVRAVDGTGAGDAFDAAFIAARLDGLDAREALAFANAAAALSVERVGARAMPARDEVMRLLQTVRRD